MRWKIPKVKKKILKNRSIYFPKVSLYCAEALE